MTMTTTPPLAALLAALAVLALGAAPSGQAAEAAAAEARWAALPRFNVTLGLDNRRLRYIPPPPPPIALTALARDVVSQLWLDQVLDHFNPKDKRTWKQRYFARTDLYQDGGPVFIYIGGEGEESKGTLAPGALFMSYLAEQFKAKLFDLEHRYYGRSHPTPDLTAASLQYLSADQALADLAYFIEFLIENGDMEEGQKVVVFGGSYPGNLAAWARIKYPHLINAAVSSSAPVLAKTDFVEYMQVVSKSLSRVAGQWCTDNVQKAFDRIVQLLKTTDGYDKVKQTFKVGSELKDKLDLDAFFETLSNPFAGAVQYNRDSMPYSAYNIKYICSKISGTGLTGDQAMGKLAALVLGDAYYGRQMYDWSYASSVKSFGSTEYTESPMRQWLYQTCTEFGYYQTFSGQGTPFPKAYNDIDYSYNLCKDIYGTEFDSAVINKGVRRSNIVFGERKPDVTNVIFVNGNVDPWHALGILEDVSPRAPAVVVDGASHCLDMSYPSSRYDSPDMVAAHKQIHEFVRSALYETPYADPAHV